MKVYLAPPPQFGIGIKRAAAALAQFAPADVEIVSCLEDADLAIFHVIGWGFLEEAKDWIAAGKPYALMQYCWRTSENPDPAAWMPFWQQARSTWSYYRLPLESVQASFYFAPMGLDPAIFTPRGTPGRGITVLTTGYIAETEGVLECAEAVRLTGGLQVHLGPDFGLGYHVVTRAHIDDDELARTYSQSRYVAGLRRCEGFEMPALEGLACGARPICFDAPHYRDWFGDHPEYVQEGTPAEVQAQLTEIFAGRYRPVTADESADVRARFAWAALVPPFWTRVLLRG